MKTYSPCLTIKNLKSAYELLDYGKENDESIRRP